MARQARALSSKGLYYVELKGERLFKTDGDRKIFMEILSECFADGGKIYGTDLSDTVIKLVVKESGAGISAAVKSLKIRYARYFNRETGKKGEVFLDRFKSIPFESETEAKAAAKDMGSVVKTASPRKTTVKTPKKTAVQKPREEKAAEVKKPSAKKNLPTWLL